MNTKKIIAVAAMGMTLTGCGIYDKYESKATVPSDGFRSSVNTHATSMAQMSWREFFTDPNLQELIEQALANNVDLNSARIAVGKAEASLKVAKMAYLPSLYFAPQGTIASFDRSAASKTYNLPLQLQMDIDVFGSVTNKKRASKAVLLQAQIQEEAVRANLISVTAQQYYMLQVLDLQLHILTATDSLWNASLETQKALYENGKSYSTAVNQMESSYLNVKTQIIDTRRNILSTENALCSLLGITPQHIKRTAWGGYPLTANITTGVPADLLQYRPDIRMANHAMEEAFYNTQAARSAFFPTITLSGTAGWTNSAGGMVIDPGKLLLSAVGQLTQPIFARGQLKGNLKVKQLTEEDLQKKYVQTVIDAGNQVNEALADCQAA